MNTQVAASQIALEAARRRRGAMKEAISRTEAAASSPTADPGWRSGLLAELQKLQLALSAHVNEVEGDDGLLNQLRTDAPPPRQQDPEHAGRTPPTHAGSRSSNRRNRRGYGAGNVANPRTRGSLGACKAPSARI